MKAINQKLADKFSALGVRITESNKTLVSRFPMRSAMALSQDYLETRKLMTSVNERVYSSVLVEHGREDFTGGSYQALLEQFKKGIDLTPHKKALAAFEKGNASKKLRATVDQLKPKRKPRLSDSDGAWDYSRRFDDKPFVDFPKQALSQKVIELWVNFAISSYASSEDINAFGAYVWSINKLIESAGIQTRIVIAMDVENVYYAHAFSNGCIEVLVKNSGEYLAPSVLAQAFTSQFYRRSIFAMHALAADFVGASCNRNLGRPKRFAPISYADGKLIVSADATRGSNENLINELTKIFTK